ncbi:MAG: efflux RND transporter permease subunit [Bacteriovorax sp.]|jgi:HAE1 family hydrophobic/amphiphilic exporter-1
MSLSSTSIKHPVFAWMLMAAMMLFGALAFRNMGVSQLPDVDIPNININVTWEGASPAVIESDVIDTLESAVLSVEGVQSIQTSIRRGSANITVEFGLDRNIDNALNDVQSKISQAQSRLPDDVEPPIVSKVNPDDQPIMWLSVADKNMSPRDLMAYVRDNVKDKFLTTEGVGDVLLSGYVDPNLRVWVDDKKLNALQLTVGDIINTVSSEHSELPSGKLENKITEFSVRTLGEAETTKEFENLSINRRGGSPNYVAIPLSSVARIEDGLADIVRKSRVNGVASIGIGIRKQRGSNAVAVGENVIKKIAVIKESLPHGMDLGINFDSTKFIKESVHELTFTLVLAALLTALVCWAFLGSWSATFNVILAIPTSILGSFIVLNAMGFTLNYFTLLALSLAIGIVVDDAIMVLENIFRHFEMGKDKRKASLDGAQEITFAAMAATVAIIAIFLPIAYMKGIIGRYFYQFAVTISVAVFLSLIEALTLTPMRTSQFMQKQERTTRLGKAMDNSFNWLEKYYERILPWVIHNRIKVILMSIFIFAASSFFVTKLRKEFVPAQDQGSILMRIKTKEGSSLDYTDEKLKDVEKYLMARPEVERIFAAIGGFGGGDASSANIFVTLKNKKQRKLTQQELLDVIRKDFKNYKGGKVFVQDTSLSSFAGSGRGFPIEIAISGSNWDSLIKTIQLGMHDMEANGQFVDVDSNFRENIRELAIIPDREQARLRGISITDLGETMSALVGGKVIGKFTREGHRYDIRIRMENITADDSNIERIKNIQLRNNRGELIALRNIADVKFIASLQSITRQDRLRTLKIYANIKTGVSQAKALDVAKTIVKKHLSAGSIILDTGSAKTFKESFESLFFVLGLGIIISYMVLASQFNSFVDPITVLVALPFSVSGAFAALYLANQSVNIYSMIGIILLMGIVKKNSILLVDFTNQVRDTDKMPITKALIHACPRRLRPILMTSFATVAGAVPAAFSFGSGAESLKPMSLAVIGGVIVSTFLTLLVVPSIYSLLSPNIRDSEKFKDDVV